MGTLIASIPITTSAEEYISGVLNGSIPAGPYLVKACKRHVNDLEHGHKRGLYFDPDAAHRVMEFIETYCIPPGQTQPMRLMPWQRFLIWVLYGWKRSNGTRRFRRSYTEIAKKNGKTALGASLCLYHLIADGELNARCYCTATTNGQAHLCFDEAVAMRSRNPELESFIKQRGNSPVLALYIPESGSRLSCMSRESSSQDGSLVSFAILDEIHRYTNKNLWSVLRYGGRTKPQPLLFGITTAGASSGGTSICWAEREYGTNVLDGFIEDDEFAVFVFGMDDKDDYKDESNWPKANPSMGSTADGYLFAPETIRKEFQETEGKPTSRGEFLRFCLNRWSSESADPAIDIEKWDACSIEPVSTNPDRKRLRQSLIESLKGRACFAGLDLAPKIDTSALVLLFPPVATGEKWKVLEYVWCPADNIADRVKRDRVPYDVWSRDGFISATPGNLTDVRYIVEQLIEINKQFDLRELAYDDSWSSELLRMLGESTFPLSKMRSFPQSFLKMNAPCQDFTRMVLREEFQHSHNPVTRWQMANLRWNTQRGTQFIKPEKDRKREKIDICVALIMALARATDPENLPKPKKSFWVVTA